MQLTAPEFMQSGGFFPSNLRPQRNVLSNTPYSVVRILFRSHDLRHEMTLDIHIRTSA